VELRTAHVDHERRRSHVLLHAIATPFAGQRFARR
jgi:hypothetical protein